MQPHDEFRSFDPASNEGIDDVLLPDQQFVVFQLAHAETAIRSPDGKAWIRCVGFTRTLDAARALARNAHDMDDKTETRIMPAGRVFLAGRLKYEGLDLPRREEEQFKANRLIDDWIAHRQKVHEDTRKLAQEKTIVEPEVRVPTPRPSVVSPFLPDLPSVGAIPPVERQPMWALAIIPDMTGEDEPALIALFAAELDQTQSLVKRAARSKDLVHVDIFVGPTGEWLPLDSPHVPTTFHHHPLRQATESHIRWVKS